MGNEIASALARLTAHLSVDIGAGAAINDAAADRYLETVAAQLPKLQSNPETAALAEKIIAWSACDPGEGDRPSRAEVELALGGVCVSLLGQSDSDAVGTAQALLAQELEARERIEQLTQRLLNAEAGEQSASNAPAFDAAQRVQLARFLGEAFGDPAMSLEIGEIVHIPGGYSKQTYFVSLQGPPGIPGEVVIRYDPSDSVIGATVGREYVILKCLHARGLRVPRPYAVEMSGTVLGKPFMVTEKAQGRSIGDSYEVSGGTREFGCSLARELAKLHRIDPKIFGDGLHGAKLATRERMRQEIAADRARWKQFGAASIAMDVAFQWLEQHIDLADRGRSLVHRDVGCHNLIVDGEVRALIDWETAAIGSPAQDLGYCKKTIIQFMPWAEFMSAYAEAGGEPPTEAEIDFYDLWGAVWIAVVASQARYVFNAGLTDNILLAYAGEHILRRDLLGIARRITQLSR